MKEVVKDKIAMVIFISRFSLSSFSFLFSLVLIMLFPSFSLFFVGGEGETDEK